MPRRDLVVCAAGLLTLGNVITALAEKAMHPKRRITVPYERSTLTQVLREALGGNCRTTMLATVSPSDVNYDDSLAVLRYAERARRIRNKAVVNHEPTHLLVTNLKEENKKLMEQLQAMMKDGVLPLEPDEEISGDEREEMRRQLQAAT